jgi:hypothetical protein
MTIITTLFVTSDKSATCIESDWQKLFNNVSETNKCIRYKKRTYYYKNLRKILINNGGKKETFFLNRTIIDAKFDGIFIIEKSEDKKIDDNEFPELNNYEHIKDEEICEFKFDNFELYFSVQNGHKYVYIITSNETSKILEELIKMNVTMV